MGIGRPYHLMPEIYTVHSKSNVHSSVANEGVHNILGGGGETVIHK